MMNLNFKKEKAGLIYHFTTSNTALFRILPQFRLRLSESGDQFTPEGVKNTNHPAGRVLSFSEDYFTDGEWWDGYSLARMWERCGENHEGVCLVIDKKEFVQENIQLIGSDEVYFEPVTYSNLLSELPIIPNVEWREDNVAEAYVRSNYQRLYFQKSKEWENEHEVRLVSFDPSIGFCSIRRSLKGIIMGTRFDRDKLRLLTERAAGKQLSRCVIENGLIKHINLEDENPGLSERREPLFSFI